MTDLKFYGGVDEIGGNRILLQDRDTRILLDFGMSFSKCEKFFEEYLKPRYSSTGIKDLVTLKLLPYIDGIYRQDLLKLIGKTVHKEPSVQGVLLSHVHQDHSAYVSFLDERIPIFCSEVTECCANSMLETGRRGLETEICNFKPRPLVDRGISPCERKMNPVESEKPFNIGSFEIKPFSVDHSVPGAMAFLIHTSDSTIVYIGDLRLEGVHGDLTQKFIDEVAKEQVDIMLCEGTRIDQKTSNTESYVEEQASAAASKCNQLVIADFSYKDLYRFLTFYNVAKRNDRRIVISKKHAFLLDQLQKVPGFDRIPGSNDKNVLIYIDKKDTGLYRPADYDQWERDYIDMQNAVKSDRMHENQSKVIACLTFFDMNELIDIDPNPGSLYINSSSEAHNEEQVIDEKRLHEWLDFFKLNKERFHASGHASGTEIENMIKAIKPKELIPIHTINQQLFMKMHGNVRIPKLEAF